MRHRVASKTFGRKPDQRRALMRGLATSLVDSGRIETTLAKAKELRKYVEPLVTLGKRGDLHARRQAAAFLYKKSSISRLFGDLAERFKDRPGGYTRIYRLGQRRGDGAQMAIIEFLPKVGETKKASSGTKKSASKKKVSSKKEAAPNEATVKVESSKSKPAAKKKISATKKKAPTRKTPSTAKKG